MTNHYLTLAGFHTGFLPGGEGRNVDAEKLDPQLPSEQVHDLTTPTHYQVFKSQGPLSKERSSGLKAA